MAHFEFVSKYYGLEPSMKLPERKTAESAGYDFYVAEDTLIPPYNFNMNEIVSSVGILNIDNPVTLNEMAAITKKAMAKPTLVPTGVKAQLDPGTYLELSVRSSCPLKYWLVLANGVGRLLF